MYEKRQIVSGNKIEKYIYRLEYYRPSNTKDVEGLVSFGRSHFCY